VNAAKKCVQSFHYTLLFDRKKLVRLYLQISVYFVKHTVKVGLLKYGKTPHVPSPLFDERRLFGQSVLTEDATNVEAIACIGMNHFYSDQPELSLRSGRDGNNIRGKGPDFVAVVLKVHRRENFLAPILNFVLFYS
jgi:hypothetical protein